MAILCASATLATHYNDLVRLQVQQPHKPIFTHPDPLLTISAYREHIIGTRAVRVKWRRAEGLPRRLRLVQQLPSFQSEIGRASCRERVVQYVEISVVAAAFKKKNNI